MSHVPLTVGLVNASLLRSIRDLMLDEREPLPGLLRKCLLLGAETGSKALRDWARSELNGYDDEARVPNYRVVHSVPISMDSMSGPTWMTGRIIDRHALPQESWQYVPEELMLRQPIEELQELSTQKRVKFSSSGLSYAQTVWNSQLGPWQNVVNLSYVLAGSTITGILGQIRTQLIDVIGDLTAETPLSELPGKAQVDAAVSHHIGQVYNTTIHEATGPLAIGTHASSSNEGITVEHALKLLDAVRQAAEETQETRNTRDLMKALEDLRETLDQESADTGDVVKKVGKLRMVANSLGVAAVTAATSSAATTITEMAMNGAFT